MACAVVLMVILTVIERSRGYHTFDKLCFRVTRGPAILDGLSLQEVHLGRCQHRTDEVIITRIGARIEIRIVTFSPFQLTTFVPIRGMIGLEVGLDRKSTRLNSSHANISYAVFCLK